MSKNLEFTLVHLAERGPWWAAEGAPRLGALAKTQVQFPVSTWGLTTTKTPVIGPQRPGQCVYAL